MASDTVRRAPSLGVGQGRGEAGGVPRWAQRLGCCWALSGRDLFKNSLGIIGLFGANRDELAYAGFMFEELRDALEGLAVERERIGEVKRVSVSVALGGRRINKKKKLYNTQ